MINTLSTKKTMLPLNFTSHRGTLNVPFLCRLPLSVGNIPGLEQILFATNQLETFCHKSTKNIKNRLYIGRKAFMLTHTTIERQHLYFFKEKKRHKKPRISEI